MILIRNLSGYGGDYTIRISGVINDKKGMTVPRALGKTGYHFVTLKKGGKEISKRVDKLVAFNWVHNPDPKTKDGVIHLDGNKQNVLPHNLRWATAKELANYKVPSTAPGVGGKVAKGLEVTDTHTGKKTLYPSPKAAAGELGLTPQKIRKAVRKKDKINNLTFKYI